jgi:hypothetical protein
VEPLNIKRDIMSQLYNFDEKEYRIWRKNLEDKIIMVPNPNGFYTNQAGVKCDQRDIIAHEFNKYCSYILNRGSIFNKTHDIKDLFYLVKYFDGLGEILEIKRIITAPDKDWNIINRVIGCCNTLYSNNLCTKECKDGQEIGMEDL